MRTGHVWEGGKGITVVCTDNQGIPFITRQGAKGEDDEGGDEECCSDG